MLRCEFKWLLLGLNIISLDNLFFNICILGLGVNNLDLKLEGCKSEWEFGV